MGAAHCGRVRYAEFRKRSSAHQSRSHRHTEFTEANRTRYRSRPARVREDVDRKSTRLNSSHGYISYAVFCLKTKPKTERRLWNSGDSGELRYFDPSVL